MLDQSAQQYYLNAMGLPLWCLRAHNQENNSCLRYIPAGIINPQVALEQAVDSLSIVEDKSIAESSSQTVQATNHKALFQEVKQEEPQAIDFNGNKPEDLPPVTLKNENLSSQQLKSSQELKSSTTNLVDSKKSSLSLYSQDWFQVLTKDISSCSLCPNRMGGGQSLKVEVLKESTNATKNLLLLVETPSLNEHLQSSYLNKEYRLLLNSIFYAIKLDVNIYISSVLKCSSKGPVSCVDNERINQETNNCLAFLQREINNLKPDLIVTLGPINMDKLADSMDENMVLEQLFSQPIELKQSLANNKQLPIIATFHPAFLYRNPLFKAKALQHWIRISSSLGMG